MKARQSKTHPPLQPTHFHSPTVNAKTGSPLTRHGLSRKSRKASPHKGDGEHKQIAPPPKNDERKTPTEKAFSTLTMDGRSLRLEDTDTDTLRKLLRFLVTTQEGTR